jgi:beta-lactamase superfamily II metal-dependent hydrolase
MSDAPKAALFGLAAIGIGWWLGGAKAGETRLTFLAVGQGDCAVIQSEGGTILVDAGPAEAVANRSILPKLRRLGVTGIDLVILTHPDTDHVAGVPVLAKSFPRARFAISAEFKESEEWKGLVSMWGLPASRIQYLPRRMNGSLGDLRIDLFCPDIWSPEQDNDGSAFVKIQIQNASAVLSGDATADSEAEAASEGDWSAQVMKAGHHGSRTSTSFAWLKEVKPEHVVISCGLENRYGHPHQETLDRVQESGAALERTDRGDVSFVLSNGKFVLER